MVPKKQVQLINGSTESERTMGMKAGFWQERWERGEIGFHQPGVNSHMQRFAGRLGVNPGAHMLVPLCGKSLDMLWLAQQGHRVTGIELSERAAEDFFTENQLVCDRIRAAGATIFRGEKIEVWVADFFRVTQGELPRIDAVYDRAALIALPPEMRPAYAEHLAGMVRVNTPVLLITLEYPQQEMNGPPFSVTGEEVTELFSKAFEIEHLLQEERLSKEPRFRKKGLTRMEEHVFLLRKKVA
jgi:thiopurine S-methyltransferase